ncbi:MAG: hypothetical protein E6K48_15430 [Gammaproteobacteria bacterium]|nr:MAG: hypothetical protein E6K48_15430 [Gammaproteobacteria bacterium]
MQMNPVKNKSERSHALPRELWPILALIFTGPVLFVNVLLGGDRALQRAWIIALIGFACFGFLGRRNGHSTVIQRVNGNGATTPTESPSESKMRLAKTRNGGVRTRSTKGGMAGWVATLTGLLALGFITGVLLTLFPLATRDGQLTAVVVVFGSLSVVAGTALAVYLTLTSQRTNDAAKIEALLRMEVAEFSRQAISRIFVFCQRVLVDRVRIPMRDLPALMEMPEAVVYKATADRISHLPYGPLLVILHGRIAEAVSMARIYAAVSRPNSSNGHSTLEPWINDKTAKTMATALLNICNVARTILRTPPEQIADAAIASRLDELDKEITQAKAVLNPSAVPTCQAAPATH